MELINSLDINKKPPYNRLCYISISDSFRNKSFDIYVSDVKDFTIADKLEIEFYLFNGITNLLDSINKFLCTIDIVLCICNDIGDIIEHKLSVNYNGKYVYKMYSVILSFNIIGVKTNELR